MNDPPSWLIVHSIGHSVIPDGLSLPPLSFRIFGSRPWVRCGVWLTSARCGDFGYLA